MKRLLGLLTALLFAIGLMPILQPIVAGAQAICAPVALVPFRGSGEGSIGATKYASVETKGWEGPTLTKLLKSLYSEHPELASTPIVEVGEAYKAVAVDQEAEKGSAFLADSPVYNSSWTGASAALKAMSDFRYASSGRGCLTTKFVLVGYSQGAMAARAVAQMEPSLIGGVYGVGDPWQQANATGVTGDGRGGIGVFRAKGVGVGAKKDAFYGLDFPKHSLCHAKDPVCDFFGAAPKFDGGPHMNYFNGVEASSEAKALANIVSRYSSTPPTTTKALNVSFVVDTTGSMSPYIGDARANIEAISQNVLRTSPNSKFSLVEYKDYGDPFIAQTVVPLTSDSAALANGIQGLTASGGGDYPESLFSGVVEGVRTLQGTTGTSAVVILRDAPPHDPEPWSGLSNNSVQRILLGIDPVPSADALTASGIAARFAPTDDREQGPDVGASTSPGEVAPPVASSARLASEPATLPSTILYDVNAAGAGSDVVGSIVDATGGRSFGIGSPQEVTTSILEAVDDASEAPVAKLGIPSIVTAGSEAVIAGINSSGQSPLQFEFDFESDGTVDATNEDGIGAVTFASPGQYTVTLTVRDPRGRTSVTSALVAVSAVEDYPIDESPDSPNGPETPSFGSSGSSSGGFNFGF